MKNTKKGHKSWHTPTLFRRALNAKNENSYWRYIWELHSRGNLEIFHSARELCLSSNIRSRQLGADVLGQLGPERPHRSESLKVLHKMLETEKSPKVLNSILTAISHSQKPEDTFGIKKISTFRDHGSKDARLSLVFALLYRTDRISIPTMIYLSRDKSPMVRDWATFGLGTQIELDTPAIRKALVERLKDPDCDTRCEALMGLAKRKDPRVKDALIKELAREDVTSLPFEAASELGDKALLTYINMQIASADKETDKLWLADAVDSRDALTRQN